MAEVEVEIETPKESKPVIEIEKPTQSPPKIIKPKAVAQLCDKEKEDIISVFKNGGTHNDYNVKFLKDGTSKITLKRKKAEPVSSQLLKEDLPRTDKKIHLSDNQLLFEHVMDLQIKCEKLMNKHKKMKKRLSEYEQYEDIDEEPMQPMITPKVEIEQEEKEVPRQEDRAPRPVSTKNRSWRSHISYI
jgi:hypothetical protein